MAASAIQRGASVPACLREPEKLAKVLVIRVIIPYFYQPRRILHTSPNCKYLAGLRGKVCFCAATQKVSMFVVRCFHAITRWKLATVMYNLIFTVRLVVVGDSTRAGTILGSTT